MTLLRNLTIRFQDRPTGPESVPLPPAATPTPTVPVRRPTLMKDILDAHDNKHENPRESDNYTHLTALVATCPRKMALLIEGHNVVRRSVTGGHRVMWKIGRAVEKFIRDSYCEATERKGVFGHWTCLCKATELRNAEWREVPNCPKCQHPVTNYKEVSLYNDEYQIVGNPDFMIIEEAGALTVVEIKSLTPNEFEDLSAAKADHKIQAASYRRLLRENGYTVTDRVIVIYCTKQFIFGSPYKEYSVDPETLAIVNTLNTLWETAAQVAEYRRTKTLPPKLDKCVEQGCLGKKPKACEKVGECFSRG